MIIVRFAGGLANRMFQYAYYKHLKSQGKKVRLDDNYKATKWLFEDVNLLHIFPSANYEKASTFEIISHFGGRGYIQKIIRHLPFIKGHKVIYYNSNKNFDMLYNMPDGKYVIGSFCCDKYFKDIRQQILHDFTFSPFENEKNKRLAIQMQKENSVAIHVRKGKDYIENNPLIKGTCPVNYYLNAIAYIKKRVDNPKFYVFSDNFDWVKENLKGFDYIPIDWNPTQGWGNHFDMQLQSCCKHNIIANSTYSWWGAWLGGNEDKIVILPEQWFADRKASEMMFVPDGWISM